VICTATPIFRPGTRPPAATPGPTVAAIQNLRRCSNCAWPAPRVRLCNTAELSRELSVGDVVAEGDVLLAVGRPASWEPVTGLLTEVRTRERGTRPLPDPSWLPGASTRAAQVPVISPCKEPGT
jgi:hypothetical protein